MADRVLVSFWDTRDDTLSPLVIIQDGGAVMPDVLRQWFQLDTRGETVTHAAALFVHVVIDQGFSVGIWNQGELTRVPVKGGEAFCRGYWEEVSHGDAGVILVEITTGKVDCYGGYLRGDTLATLHNPTAGVL